MTSWILDEGLYAVHDGVGKIHLELVIKNKILLFRKDDEGLFRQNGRHLRHAADRQIRIKETVIRDHGDMLPVAGMNRFGQGLALGVIEIDARAVIPERIFAL